MSTTFPEMRSNKYRLNTERKLCALRISSSLALPRKTEKRNLSLDPLKLFEDAIVCMIYITEVSGTYLNWNV